MTDKVTDLVKKRAAAFESFNALADQDTLTAEESAEYVTRQAAVVAIDDQIKRNKESQRLAAVGAVVVAGQEERSQTVEVHERDPYTNEADAKAMGLGTSRGLRAVASAKMFYAAGSNVVGARALAVECYGENHSITRSFNPRRGPGQERALQVSVGASGGFIVPPDYVAEIIELLRPKAVVRASNPRSLPMPRGTMTLPNQQSAATATYGTEGAKINTSQQTLGQITATYKKLTAMVPVTNDMMRYADPAADAFVRDDLVKVMALREDLAFILGDGTQATPRGFISFANGWVAANAGTVGVWSQIANSTLAVNGVDPSNSTGGNFITANETYTLATVASELGGAIGKLDAANVDEDKRVWFMNPRSWNYMYNVQNSLGVYVYRDEMKSGTLLGYPFKKTTQIPTNYFDATGSHTDCSFIFLVEMDDALLLDSMTLELAVSREGSYVDAGGNTVSAFQSDQTLIRAIAEHDFQMRHDQSIAVIQNVRYAPAIS
jgi:HK97 family phage major capsid protein